MNFITVWGALKNNTLESINSSEFERFTQEEWLEIIDVFKVNKSVKEIILTTDDISITIIKHFCDVLKINKFVERFQFVNIKVDKTIMAYILETFKTNRAIFDFGLINCDLNDEILIEFIELISYSPAAITKINLRNNLITAESTQAFVILLMANHSISTIDLSNNNINDLGVQTLATALKQNDKTSYYADANSYLLSLSLGNNLITEIGALAILSSITDNKVIIHLDLSNDNLSPQYAQILEHISALLERNKQLRKQFLDLTIDFEKIDKIETQQKSTNVYKKNDDQTKWIIKTNSQGGLRLGVIKEAYACQLMMLVIPDYPTTILVNDGGSFQIGYESLLKVCKIAVNAKYHYLSLILKKALLW